jgi:hypothetical protein
MLKGIFSNNVRTQRAGARNAAWDICMLQQFGRFARGSEQSCWGLWSSDVALRQTAQSLFVRGDECDEAALGAFYRQRWGARDGARLFAAYRQQSMAVGIGSDARIANVSDTLIMLDRRIAELERGLGFAVE